MSATDSETVADLDPLARAVTELGDGGTLPVVPKVPSLDVARSAILCELTPGDVRGEAFLVLAQHAGARMLYADIDIIHADELLASAAHEGLPEFVSEDIEQWRALQQRLRDADGRCAEMQLAFTDHSVLLTWTAEAAWAISLREELSELVGRYEFGADPATAAAMEPQRTGYGYQGPSRSEVNRHAAYLASLPEFRGAALLGERQRIAGQAVEELADGRRGGVNRLGDLAVEEASYRVKAAREDAFAQLTADMPALARRLAEAGVLQGGSGVRSRVGRVKAALQEWSGGYRPTTDLAKDVEFYVRNEAANQESATT